MQGFDDRVLYDKPTGVQVLFEARYLCLCDLSHISQLGINSAEVN